MSGDFIRDVWKRTPDDQRGSIVFFGIGLLMFAIGLDLLWGFGASLIGLGTIIMVLAMTVWL